MNISSLFTKSKKITGTNVNKSHWSNHLNWASHQIICYHFSTITIFKISFIIIIIINPLTAKVVGAPQMILQPVFSIFPCSALPSGTCRTPGLSIPWCCLPTSFFVCLVFFLLSLCLARWFWPDLMNERHDHTTSVCVSLLRSGGLRVVRFSAGSWHGPTRW